MARNVVEIWSSEDGFDAPEHLDGLVRLVNGRIRFEGLSKVFVGHLINDGILGEDAYAGVVFPKDGRKFLDALRFEFSGSFLRAKFADDENT